MSGKHSSRLLVLLLIMFTCEATESSGFNYDDNIGFMADVPQELQEAFPVCDKFLDVKWIRKAPGTENNWIGTIISDIYIYDKKDRREFVFFSATSSLMFDISPSEYKGDRLERLIMSADEFSTTHSDDDVIMTGCFVIYINNESVFVTRRSGLPRMNSNYDYPRRSFTHFSQNICFAQPDNKVAWLIENKNKALFFENLNDSAKAQAELLKRLISKDCLQKKGLSGLPIVALCKKLHEDDDFRKGKTSDCDGDGRIDVVFRERNSRLWIAFFNDEKPFIMPYPKTCQIFRPRNIIKFKKRQQCMAKEKKIFLNKLLKDKG